MFQQLLPTFFFSFFTFISLFSQQTVLATLMHDGLERDYRLYIPSGYDAANPAPLVFNLHGFGSNAEQQESYSEMNEVAEVNNFLTCHPNGFDNAWNVGWTFGSTADDVGFISALVDELAANYSINLARVYSCGMSNGGYMSYRLANELNDKIAAVASVTGSMVPGYDYAPGKPVPILHIHGTSDGVVPYTGSTGLAYSAVDVINFWIENNGCAASAVVTDIENISLTDMCTAKRFDYNDCNNSRVSLIQITGGGHTWPGASIDIGITNQDFSASEVIWQFFSQFDLNGPTSSIEKFEENKITVFPNPAHDFINVNTNELFVNGDFEIYNNFSQKIKSGKINGNNFEINTADLIPGIYYLTVKDLGKFSRQVFVKR
ncbi:MAG: PHB depolymerase family esterase [Bacteroidota bacterium]